MVYIVSGMWMQPYFIYLLSVLTAIVSKSQMKKIQRTCCLLKIFHIFVQFVADDLFKHVFYHGLISLVDIIYLFIFIYFFPFLLQKGLFLSKRKKHTTFI